jgi:hypothetical protein
MSSCFVGLFFGSLSRCPSHLNRWTLTCCVILCAPSLIAFKYYVNFLRIRIRRIHKSRISGRAFAQLSLLNYHSYNIVVPDIVVGNFGFYKESWEQFSCICPIL